MVKHGTLPSLYVFERLIRPAVFRVESRDRFGASERHSSCFIGDHDGGRGMTSRKAAGAVFTALVLLIGLPNTARAQSAIAGVVKDSSGAVLPGVTVEASSDVLIEKTGSVAPDGQGESKL